MGEYLKSGSALGKPSNKPKGASRQPSAAIDYFSRSGDHNLTVVTPLDFDFAAFHDDSYFSVDLFIDHRRYSSGTRARSRSACLSNTALPYPQLQSLAILDAREHNVRSVRKQPVRFEYLSNVSPVERIEVVDKDRNNGIADLEGGDRILAAVHFHRVFENLFEGRIDGHRYGARIKLWLAQL